MNTQHWIAHFEANTRLNHELTLPDTACTLPEHERAALARSIAIFQLGESGGGTRLRHYTRSIISLENLQGYQRAVDLFVAEEQSHAALLARTVAHLRGTLLQKQWTNSIFRWMRDLVNLEFNIQVLLTAELIAEVYFGLLALRCSDPVVQTVAKNSCAMKWATSPSSATFSLNASRHSPPPCNASGAGSSKPFTSPPLASSHGIIATACAASASHPPIFAHAPCAAGRAFNHGWSEGCT
jgi:hypothetical protein